MHPLISRPGWPQLRRAAMATASSLLLVVMLAGACCAAATSTTAQAPPAVAAVRPPQTPQTPQASGMPQTPCEASGFENYTTYEEMMAYLQEVQSQSVDMSLGVYGETFLGRDLPYAVFSRPSVRRPWEAMELGRPIVLLNANVHGGERTLRESLLIMIREMATRGTALNDMLVDLVVVVAPSVNPDGFVARTRGNSWGQDMNRDYMKLEQQALAHFVGDLVNVWHPHVAVDGHNGGSYPYNICYQGPSNAAPDQRITDLLDQAVFPYVSTRMEQNGYRAFYYSGASRADSTVWNGGGYDPRINRNYHGFQNQVGILYESPGGQEIEIGVRSGMVAYTAVMEYSRDHAAEVTDLVRQLRIETIQMGDAPTGDVPVQMEYVAEDWTIAYDIVDRSAQQQQQQQPERGRQAAAERPLITVTDGKLMKKPNVLLARERPYAYLLPRQADEAVTMLERHGIAVEVLQEEIEVEVQVYALGEVSYQREYDHDAAVNITVGEVVTETRTFPVGTYVIPTGQMMGRVASHLIEPETNDNIFHWNTMDALLPVGPPPRMGGRRPGGDPEQAQQAQAPPLRILPVFKVMQPTPMPTKLHDPGD